MQNEEKKQLKNDLNQFDNIGDMFLYLNRKYDLIGSKIGPILKPVFIDGIIKAFEMIKPKKR